MSDAAIQFIPLAVILLAIGATVAFLHKRGTAEEKRGRVAIAGWLILVSFGQVFGPLALLVRNLRYYDSFAFMEALARFPMLIGGEFVLNVALVGVVVYTSYLFFKKSSKFPAWFSTEVVAAVLSPIIGLIWVGQWCAVYGIPNPIDSSVVYQAIGAAIGASFGGGLWIAYMLRSERVKRTFVY